MPEYAFRKLDLKGTQQLLHWAADEGWNPGLHDAELFYNTDPDGFYGYFLEEEMIGGGAIVSYGGAFGFMGLFIVAPAHRHAGIGRSLWYQRRDTLISRLNPGASIGMDGVVAMQPFYAKGGFQMAFRDERYAVPGAAYPTDRHVQPYRSSDLNEILQMDLMYFGFDRNTFIRPWLVNDGHQTFVYRNDDGALAGFATMRKTISGYKIGPLFADDALLAEALLKTCLSSVPGETFYLDIPVSNPNAVHLVNRYPSTYVFECGRMYYGTTPTQAIHHVFGVTTFELG